MHGPFPSSAHSHPLAASPRLLLPKGGLKVVCSKVSMGYEAERHNFAPGGWQTP